MTLETPIVIGHLEMQPVSCAITWRGRSVGLSYSEYRYVYALASNFGRTISYADLYSTLRPSGFAVGDATSNVRVAIKRVRDKFRAVDSTFDQIMVLSKVGYRWVAPEGTKITSPAAELAVLRIEYERVLRVLAMYREEPTVEQRERDPWFANVMEDA